MNSNKFHCSIVKTGSNLLDDKNTSQFKLKPVEASSKLFKITILFLNKY